jgi:HAE1 family hydrophobic/amphiphilic exporter-1
VAPEALAARGITLQEVFHVLDSENQNVSAGDLEEAKRRYVVRTVGQYTRPEDVENVVLKDTGRGPIRVRDVARAQLGYREPDVVVRNRGVPTLVMNAVRAVGANILDVMERLKRAVDEINRDILEPRDLQLIQVYDETEYIYSAIALVRQNLWVGGTFAILVLVLFLRSFTSTLIVATAIPISITGTFVLMALLGRTINVISLAGLAFAVGIVVDNAIVALENIFRHRQAGEGRREAAYNGVVEVWGAMLASTLTTVAVFLPVIFVQEEVGQLFRDIAVAVSCAVTLSLIVAITVIPTMAFRILRLPRRARMAYEERPSSGRKARLPSRKRLGLDAMGRGAAAGFSGFFGWVSRGVIRRVVVILVMTGLSVGAAKKLMPKTEYLPQGNRNLVFGFVIPPPGYNVDELTRVGAKIEEDLAPYWRPAGNGRPNDGYPGIRNFFFVARGRMAFMGTICEDPERVRELIPLVKEASQKIPGLLSQVQQSTIFGRASEGRSVDVEIRGPDLEQLIAIGGRIFATVLQGMSGAQPRPIPSLDLGEPEVRIIPDRDRAASLGLTASEIGRTVAALVDGVVVSDYWDQGDKIDLVLLGQGQRLRRIQDLERMQLQTPRGERVTLGDVAKVELVSGPQQINHVERLRAIVIRVVTPEEVPLQEAMEWIEKEAVVPLREEGLLVDPYEIRIAGTARKLNQTWNALKWNFLLALIISFLLMAALFENFLYPLVILFTVPLAAVGGFLGLFAVNLRTYQPLDVLTMLGFIILVGIVVNNAILLVHQALLDMRGEGIGAREAIGGAIQKRVRPIFMSAATSICGMLPLVLFPGAGSELYRGLGSVVVGGLAVSTLFTLILVPTVLSLVLDARVAVGRLIGGRRTPSARS